MSDEQNVHDAKKSLKHHIKFFESLKSHLTGPDEVQKARAMWATWCLHRYINDFLISDIEKAMAEFGAKHDAEHQ